MQPAEEEACPDDGRSRSEPIPETALNKTPEDELLDRLGLSPKDAATRIADYSKGMQQKVAYVQAILHNPDIAFLDEPTSGLDPRAARTLRELIRELTRINSRGQWLKTNVSEETRATLAGLWRYHLGASIVSWLSVWPGLVLLSLAGISDPLLALGLILLSFLLLISTLIVGFVYDSVHPSDSALDQAVITR